jgi:hypothetical protein
LALERTPLDPASLSDAARKVLTGVGPIKLMAAKGLAPLARPADVATVLYALSFDGDAVVKTAAEKTAGELPDKILGPALADTTLDPRVLDFFAGRVTTRPVLLESILLNRVTADETVAALVPRLGEKEIELVSQNEQRLLRLPAIIGAMYMNPKARMSTVDRAVELAVRNNLTVPGIPHWEDVVQAVLGTKGAPSTVDVDAVFKAVAEVAIGDKPEAAVVLPPADPDEAAKLAEEEKKDLRIDQLSIPGKIRLATLGNAFARSQLIRDSNRQVSMAAIRSPGVSDNEAVKYSSNRSLSDDVIRYISQQGEWTKLYQIKMNLVNNPKTPLQVAMRFLPFLRDKDLKLLAKSKGIASALSAQAKKLVAAKTGGA